MQHADSTDLKTTSPTLSAPHSEVPDATTHIPITAIADEATAPLPAKSHFSPKVQQLFRFMVLLVVVTCLIIGRSSVPDNEVHCIEDRIFQAFDAANNFINQPGNEIFRDTFQIIDSFLIDIVFVITFGYWVARGTTCRLPITLTLFYLVRALVQQIHLSPFPSGWYFMGPGIPSLVVPYGRGSDFFFSGHAGFLIVCAKEWHRVGKAKVRNFALFVAAYTILLLLVYRVHYFIDIFTGVFFADYCFDKIDGVKEQLDKFFSGTVKSVFDFLERGMRLKTTDFEEKRLVNNV